MQTRMCPDDVAWEQAEETSDNWLARFLEVDFLRPIADFVLTYNRGIATEFAILRKGSYNISLRLKYRNGATVIRLSQPGAVFFPEEKVVNEVTVMRFLADQTSIPVPFIIHSGTKEESPLQLSPFIVMDYIEHETKMYNVLNIPECPTYERGILDPNIAEDRLEMLYGQLADVVLRLSMPSFPRIGSLEQIDDFTWEVARRPLSMNMNEIVRLGGLPRSKIPDLHTTFNTASSYLEALAELNIEHLKHQRNDAVSLQMTVDGNMWRGSFSISSLRTSVSPTHNWKKGPFKIWCDDLRPANVLLNKDMHIASVKPEYWSKGIEDWTRVFDYRLKTFLKVMKGREDLAIQQGHLKEDQRLSGHMCRSWETGDFWIMYAFLHSFAFDMIYWQEIDARFFRPTGDPDGAWRERLDLLDEKEKDEMEELVSRKLIEMESRVLAWDPDEYTKEFHQRSKERREKANEIDATASM
ncbi:unnamed protein product [Penicillium salamii]|uniref:Aminoglycoside phosphotransferase domain-containing protein n=1 Tax=Penicillium salamii TaxID=1612424 RepID=A0A9W4INB0_9EURO|nr:unnamed protein product [Penicillium salamii]